MFQEFSFSNDSSVCGPRFRTKPRAPSDCSSLSMDSFNDSLESISVPDFRCDDFIYQVSFYCGLLHSLIDGLQVQFKFTFRYCANISGLTRLQMGQFVILEGRHGQVDLGVVSRVFTPDQFAQNDDINKETLTIGNITRCATEEERAHLPFKHSQEVKLLQISKFLVEQMRIPIKVYGIDYQFDGQRVTVFYTAEGPVPKEAFVAELFKCCHTNISMVQTSRRMKFSLQPFAIRALTTGYN